MEIKQFSISGGHANYRTVFFFASFNFLPNIVKNGRFLKKSFEIITLTLVEMFSISHA